MINYFKIKKVFKENDLLHQNENKNYNICIEYKYVFDFNNFYICYRNRYFE